MENILEVRNNHTDIPACHKCASWIQTTDEFLQPSCKCPLKREQNQKSQNKNRTPRKPTSCRIFCKQWSISGCRRPSLHSWHVKMVHRSHTSHNKCDLHLFGADKKHRKNPDANKKRKSTHFLSTSNFGIDLRFPWHDVHQLFKFDFRNPCSNTRTRDFLQITKLFFAIPSLKFQILPEILHLTPLCYRAMSSVQSNCHGSDKEELHTWWFFTNFWIMSRNKINLSAAHSLLLHFFPWCYCKLHLVHKKNINKSQRAWHGCVVCFVLNTERIDI